MRATRFRPACDVELGVWPRVTGGRVTVHANELSAVATTSSGNVQPQIDVIQPEKYRAGVAMRRPVYDQEPRGLPGLKGEARQRSLESSLRGG